MNTSTETTSPRQRIIDTALKLFFEKGYLATGINQIIAEAGVCKATFYDNFPSKEALCMEYVRASHENWMALLGRELEKHQAPYDRVMAVFDFLEGWMRRCDYRGCGLMNIASEVPDAASRIREAVRARNLILKNTLEELLRELKSDDPRYRRIDARQLSDLLFIVTQGAIVASQNDKSVDSIRTAKRTFARTLHASTEERPGGDPR